MLGCGTGTLAVLIKQLYPRVEVTGLDPDPKALARARRKAERADAKSASSRDLVTRSIIPRFLRSGFSSFMFHHLESDQKVRHSARSPARAETGRPPASAGFRRYRGRRASWIPAHVSLPYAAQRQLGRPDSRTDESSGFQKQRKSPRVPLSLDWRRRATIGRSHHDLVLVTLRAGKALTDVYRFGTNLPNFRTSLCIALGRSDCATIPGILLRSLEARWVWA